MRLGRMLLEGQGVARDRAGGVRLFSVRRGDAAMPKAQNMLGRCYENGWGTAPDFARGGGALPRRPPRPGSPGRSTIWAICCSTASAWRATATRRSPGTCGAAAQGHARAMNLVARCLEQGWGVTRDAGGGARLVPAVGRRRLFSRRLQLRQPSWRPKAASPAPCTGSSARLADAPNPRAAPW